MSILVHGLGEFPNLRRLHHHLLGNQVEYTSKDLFFRNFDSILLPPHSGKSFLTVDGNETMLFNKAKVYEDMNFRQYGIEEVKPIDLVYVPYFEDDILSKQFYKSMFSLEGCLTQINAKIVIIATYRTFLRKKVDSLYVSQAILLRSILGITEWSLEVTNGKVIN